VLTALGLNLRERPDPSANRITTLRQAVQLDVMDAKTVGAQTWLHVKAHSGTTDGWVLNDPALIIDIPVAQAIDTSNGYSILYPQDWSRTADDPATTSFAGSTGDSMSVKVVDDPGKYPQVPTGGGQPVRDEQVDIYGRTAVMNIFRTGGGFEFAAKVAPLDKDKDKDHRHFLFDFQQAGRPNPEPGRFKQFLGSVVIAPAS
jgi:hypothetical protein